MALGNESTYAEVVGVGACAVPIDRELVAHGVSESLLFSRIEK